MGSAALQQTQQEVIALGRRVSKLEHNAAVSKEVAEKTARFKFQGMAHTVLVDLARLSIVVAAYTTGNEWLLN